MSFLNPRWQFWDYIEIYEELQWVWEKKSIMWIGFYLNEVEKLLQESEAES